MLPTPGMSAVPHAKKKPVLAYELFLKYGGEGGIDSLRSPLLGPSIAPAGPTQALFKNAPGVFVGATRSQARGLSNWRCQWSNPVRVHPPGGEYKKRARTCVQALFEYGGEFDSLRSPLPARTRGLTGVASCRTLSSHPPVGHMQPVHAYELFLKYGGEGGLTRSLAPAGRPARVLAVCPTGVPVVEPRSGFSSPVGTIKKKARTCTLLKIWRTRALISNMAVRGDSNPDTLPYTHFPGVLLQPLGHLTILSCCSPWVGNGALL